MRLRENQRAGNKSTLSLNHRHEVTSDPQQSLFANSKVPVSLKKNSTVIKFILQSQFILLKSKSLRKI
jgi:hypothetical protein